MAPLCSFSRIIQVTIHLTMIYHWKTCNAKNDMKQLNHCYKFKLSKIIFSTYMYVSSTIPYRSGVFTHRNGIIESIQANSFFKIFPIITETSQKWKVSFYHRHNGFNVVFMRSTMTTTTLSIRTKIVVYVIVSFVYWQI